MTTGGRDSGLYRARLGSDTVEEAKGVEIERG